MNRFLVSLAILIASAVIAHAQVAIKTVASLATPCLANGNYTEIVELRAGGTSDGFYHCNADHSGWTPMGLAGLGAGDMLKANNLSDLLSASTARTNLGISNINNTSDANKPVSTATQAALDLKAATDLSNVNGTVSVSNFPATQPVSGTFFQATQPVSIAFMPSTSVTGTFWQSTQPVSLSTNTPDVTDRVARLLGHVTVDNLPATQPVSMASAPLPSGASTEATLAAIKAKTDNLDVLLSTRTKPADTQPVSNTNLDVLLSTRLKPADTLAGVTLVSAARVVGNAGGAIDAANNAVAPANVVVTGLETATQGTTQPTAATAGNVRRPVQSTDGSQYVRIGGAVTWSCGLDSIGATLTQCQAAPAAGLKLYVTDIVAQSTTTTGGQFGLRFGTGTNCGTGTGNLFPSATATARYSSPANTVAPTFIHFIVPLSLTAANAVCVLGVATNTTTITINGYTGP